MQTSYLYPWALVYYNGTSPGCAPRTVLAFIHEAVAIDGVITLYRVTKFPCGEPTKNVIRMPVECPSGEVHLQSGVTPRDDSCCRGQRSRQGDHAMPRSRHHRSTLECPPQRFPPERPDSSRVLPPSPNLASLLPKAPLPARPGRSHSQRRSSFRQCRPPLPPGHCPSRSHPAERRLLAPTSNCSSPTDVGSPSPPDSTPGPSAISSLSWRDAHVRTERRRPRLPRQKIRPTCAKASTAWPPWHQAAWPSIPSPVISSSSSTSAAIASRSCTGIAMAWPSGPRGSNAAPSASRTPAADRVEMTTAELAALLAGIDLDTARRRVRYSRPATPLQNSENN